MKSVDLQSVGSKLAAWATSTRDVRVNGISLHCVSRGNGEPILLLHGFPETHRSWDLQLPALLDAGYRTITPDLRGYGQSEKPRSGYDLDTLTSDVAGLVDELGIGPVSVVGHDWGGVLTWQLLERYPEKVARAIVIDAPHPAIMAKALRTNPTQRKRSWYIFFFQLPIVPEWWLRKHDGQNLMRMFRRASPGASQVSAELVRAEASELLEHGVRWPLRYYRTMFRQGLLPMLRGQVQQRYGTTSVPVTLIWGEADSCLGVELIDGTERFASRLVVHRVPDAGHFVHQERPEIVNQLLLNALCSR